RRFTTFAVAAISHHPIPVTFTTDLFGFDQPGQRVGDATFAALVALQTHFVEDVVSRNAVVFFKNREDVGASVVPALRHAVNRRSNTGLHHDASTSLNNLIGVDRL